MKHYSIFTTIIYQQNVFSFAFFINTWHTFSNSFFSLHFYPTENINDGRTTLTDISFIYISFVYTLLTSRIDKNEKGFFFNVKCVTCSHANWHLDDDLWKVRRSTDSDNFTILHLESIRYALNVRNIHSIPFYFRQ